MSEENLKSPLFQPFSQTTVTRVCRLCDQQFESSQFEFMGVVLSARVCNPCALKRDLDEQEAAELRRQRIIMANAVARESNWQTICPKEYRIASESGGNTDLARIELEQPRLKELMTWNGPRGLIIRGPTGTCKTRSLWRLIRRLYVEGKRVSLLTAAQFDRECRDAGGNFTLTQWFDRLARLDVLILDDLGKHPWTPATEATWFDLVDIRTREEHPIIITTNDTGDTLAARMAPERAEACIRRLRDYCDSLVFKKSDSQ